MIFNIILLKCVKRIFRIVLVKLINRYIYIEGWYSGVFWMYGIYKCWNLVYYGEKNFVVVRMDLVNV